MTLTNDINRFFDKPANRRKVLMGIGGYCLVAVAFSGVQRLTERVAAPTAAPAPVAVAAPAPVAEPAPKPIIRSYDPVGNAMLTAARNNYHRCRQENGTDVLGYAACEDARQTYEYARKKYAF